MSGGDSATGPDRRIDLADAIRERLDRGQRVRRSLSGGGRVRIDRSLPFLCVHRSRPGRRDIGTSALVTTEAAYLFASGSNQDELARIFSVVRDHGLERFNAFLLVEIWSSDSPQPAAAVLEPRFRVIQGQSGPKTATLEAFRQALLAISINGHPASVDMVEADQTWPPGLGPLSGSSAEELECHHIGVEVRPIYRDAEGEKLYPVVLSALRRQFAVALRNLFFSFASQSTDEEPAHFHIFGPTSFTEAATLVDQQLCDVSESFDYLLQITPTNCDAAWVEFERGGCRTPPVFHYRPLQVSPSELKRALYEVPVDRIEDSTIGEILREKQDELDRRISALRDIGTPEFLHDSVQIHGLVTPDLLELAESLLHLELGTPDETFRSDLSIDGREVARLARVEVGRYRKLDSTFTATVILCDDIASGIMVSKGQVLVSKASRVLKKRVNALLQHEIGTHVLTLFNGQAQPFQQLHAGLAGYESLQEGLAVFMEHLVGGLTVARMRRLAARVIAAHNLVGGETFVGTFQCLHEGYRFAPRVAFLTTLRAYRGGGSTKDIVYLRGLRDLLVHLGRGLPLDRLFVGKISFFHLPDIEELAGRGVVQPPRLLPHFLNTEAAQKRLADCRGKTVMDLVEGLL